MAYPNYFNQYPQYQPQYPVMQNNPYMDRINNLQQYQQSLQPQQMQMQSQNTLGGKVVDSIDAVKATDIPMDGNMYYFPQADGTAIFGKRWLNNGTTEIVIFKPEFAPENSQTVNSSPNTQKAEIDPLNAMAETILKRFDGMDERFDKLEKSIKAKSTPSRAKKEYDEE